MKLSAPKILFSCLLFFSLLMAACSGGAKPPPGKPCLVNSECASPLACSYGICHVACFKPGDCGTGQDCIKGTSGNVCQLPVEKHCEYHSQCASPLKCALDRQCRSECQADIDCPLSTQKCIGPDMVCAEAADVDSTTHLLKKAQSTPVPDAPPPDGGAGDGGASDGGIDVAPDGSGGTSAGGTGGSGGTGGGGIGGIVGGPCATTFGEVVKGDAVAAFTSGLGVRTADQILIFSGYRGPTPAGFGESADAGADGGDADAAVPTGDFNFIFVQAFDLATGAMAGPATPLLKVDELNMPFFVADIAIAPTGEIALLHASNELHSTGDVDTLYATFISPVTKGQAVHVARTVKLESSSLGRVHVIWSVPSQAFVLSWKYHTVDWFVRVRKFLATGFAAGGDTAAVPTVSPITNVQDLDETSVGVSGTQFGVVTRQYPSGHPTLTILNGDGSQVGTSFVELSTVNLSQWTTIGGTAKVFVSFFRHENTLDETYAATSSDGGVPLPASDGGVDAGPAPFPGFSFATTAITGKAVNDDTGGMGGVGLGLLEQNGAGFVYVKADGVSHLTVGTVISLSGGTELGVSNYRGSYAVSLFDGTTHATQVTTSGCR